MVLIMIWNKGKGYKVNRKIVCFYKKNFIQFNLYKEEYYIIGNIYLFVWQVFFLQYFMYFKLFISYYVKWEKFLMLFIFC